MIQLIGVDASARSDVAAAAGEMLGIHLCAIRAETIPASPAESEALMRLWEREAILSNLALMIVCRDSDSSHATHWAETARFPVMVSSRERFTFDGRSVLTLDPQRRVSRWSGSDFQQEEPLLEIGPTGSGGFSMNLFSQDGHFLATGSTNGLLQVWDVPGRVLYRQLTNAPTEVVPLCFLDGGNKLVTFSVGDR